jgi:5-methylcytosine-specific restriction enzyme subunit McrC
LLVKEIVRKGLKRSYYRINTNLHSKIKGKIVVSDTIKHNLLKCKNLDTICSYEEFGINGIENRLIKKTLIFIQRYLPIYQNFASDTGINDLFSYVLPAFIDVSDKVEISELRHSKTNVFFKEYKEAIHLSKIILRRYGYNIRNVGNQEVSTPPYWIDMSKLFELYVLGLLKDRFHQKVYYHYTYRGNELDFLLKSDDYQIVIDAKYKPKYIEGHLNEDIRQVSGYARLKNVYEFLEKEYPESIECLIIYPDQIKGLDTLLNANLTDPDNEIPMYNGIYKLAVKLPVLGV